MTDPPSPATAVELDLHGITHGGEAVGRLPDGKACFVPYAIPGERVRVEVTEDHRRWARARLIEVVEPSPDRVDAPCPYFGPGRCGGCRLQHVAPARQARMLRRVVTEQLERLGKISGPPVAETVRPHPGDGLGYRARARMAVDPDGRLGFRRAGSHDVEPIDRCLLLHPATQQAREQAGDGWGGVEEVVVRASTTGPGSRPMLEVHPGPDALPPLPESDVDVSVVGADGVAVPLRGEATLIEEVAGMSLQISATSFFQASVAGAEALLGLVREAADVRPGDHALDLFAGVGLFAGGLATDGAVVTAVESNPAACADARANLGAADPPATVVQGDSHRVVRDWERERRTTDVVVLDPPRRGAGTALARRLAALRSRTIVYVSCDPAALARDAQALIAAGYPLRRAVPVDQFTHTAQIETVATFAA